MTDYKNGIRQYTQEDLMKADERLKEIRKDMFTVHPDESVFYAPSAISNYSKVNRDVSKLEADRLSDVTKAMSKRYSS